MKCSEETKKKISLSLKGNTNCVGRILSTETKSLIGEHNKKPKSEFGRKFKEHFGITKFDNPTLYGREKRWYYTHNNKCRWEE